MKEKTDKILTLVLLGLSIVASILAVLFALGSDPKHIMQGITELGNSNSVAFDIAFWMLVILIGVALCAIVVFLCKKLFARFREEKGYLKKFLILVIVIVALLVVSFLLANGNDVPAALLDKHGLSVGASKLIGAACILVYIIVIGAALSILVTEVMPKSNKKK